MVPEREAVQDGAAEAHVERRVRGDSVGAGVVGRGGVGGDDESNLRVNGFGGESAVVLGSASSGLGVDDGAAHDGDGDGRARVGEAGKGGVENKVILAAEGDHLIDNLAGGGLDDLRKPQVTDPLNGLAEEGVVVVVAGLLGGEDEGERGVGLVL